MKKRKQKGIGIQRLNDLLVEQAKEHVATYGVKIHKRPVYLDIIKQTV